MKPWSAVLIALAAAIAVAVACWPSVDDAAVWGRPMAAEDLPVLSADEAGDRRLLAHFTARLGGRLEAWVDRLPADAQPLYATLRLEEIARTDGLARGVAAVPRGQGDVEPVDAAGAYEVLGVPTAAELMRVLAALIERDGAAWRDASAAGGPDRAAFERIAAGLAGLLPEVRTARLRWAADHREALGLR